jgi:hypothetical protein
MAWLSCRRRRHVQGGEPGRRQRRDQVGDAGQHQREAVAGAEGGQRVVDAEGDQRRAGHPGRL